MLFLANEIRNYLIEEDLVRSPEALDEEPLAPCFVEYEEGCPAADDLAEETGVEVPAVVNITYQGSEPTNYYEGFREVRIVSLEVRATKSRDALELAEEITQALDDKVHEELGNLLVSNCRMVEAPNRISWRYPGQGATYVCSFRIGYRRSDAA